MKSVIFFVYFAFYIGSISAALRPRIIGGEDADIKEFPYQASLRIDDKHICGGCIIGDKHVLTAAHCITYYIKSFVPPYRDVSVVIGTRSSASTTNVQRIASITIHPEYTGVLKHSYINDIAVITLIDGIRFNERQQKVKLPSHDVVTGTTATFTGWGFLSERAQEPSFLLQKLKMTLLDHADCQPQQALKIHKNQLCAYHSKGHGFCFGDSGGPLVDDADQLVGIASWIAKTGCATGEPEVYTNVYAHKAFIEAIMKK